MFHGTGLAAAALMLLPMQTAAKDAPTTVTGRMMIKLVGTYEAGAAPGVFAQAIDLTTGHNRLDVTTGPVREESGFDGQPWLRHDGILVRIDMQGSVQDARAKAFLLRGGWREHGSRALLGAAAGASDGAVVATPPGASPMRLWLEAGTGDLLKAVIDADMGPFEMRFSDWRTIGKTRVAFRREERDATGQTVVMATRTAEAVRPDLAAIAKPAFRIHGRLSGPPEAVPFLLSFGERGHIVVPVTLNGRNAKLVFDSGAANYLTPEVAKSYGLAVAGGLDVGGVGSESIAGGYARLRRISIGPAVLENSTAIVAPLPEAATHPRPGLVLQGLTGFEFLTAFQTTIDYGRRTISFAPLGTPVSAANALPFRSDGAGIFVEATVADRKGWFRLDTGDSGTVTLFKTFANAVGQSSGGEKRVASGQMGGDLVTRVVQLKSFQLGEQVLTDVSAEIADQEAGAFASRSVAGNIGAGILSQYVIVIDHELRRVALVPAASQPANAEPSPSSLR